MSHSTAHLAHDHNTAGERTIREWAEMHGRKTDSVMKTVRRKLGNGHSLDSTMSADQFADLFAMSAVIVRPERKKSADNHTPKPTGEPKPKPQAKTTNRRKTILYTLMAMPAAASVQNMYSVTSDIAAHTSTAILLTGLFSATPFLFVLAGMRTRWTMALTGVMIAYECFANTVRIYGGLTGFGHGDFPTRFLGLVTDILYSGTYITATFLSVIMAGMAAAVFYAAYHELNKPAQP